MTGGGDVFANLDVLALFMDLSHLLQTSLRLPAFPDSLAVPEKYLATFGSAALPERARMVGLRSQTIFLLFAFVKKLHEKKERGGTCSLCRACDVNGEPERCALL